MANPNYLSLPMNYSRPVILLITGILAACNTSSTPFIDNCKLMVQSITNETNIQWDQADKSEKNSGMLVVDLAFSGQTLNQTASCYFPSKHSGNQELTESGQYRGSPSFVTINGQKIDDETVVKATLDTMREFGKQNLEQAADAADTLREVGNQAAEKARKTAIEAAATVQEKLEKMDGQ